MMLESDLLEIKNDVGDIFHNSREGGEFVRCSSDLYRGDGGSFQRREQNAAEGVANGVSITSFKGLSHKLAESFRGSGLVFNKAAWHFESC